MATPSPDWTPYVDLTVYDQDADQILDDAVDYGRTALPEWVPEVGSIEITLLEMIAVESANVVAAANRVPGATVETLLKLYGIDRDDGQKATATVDFTMVDSLGHTIPADTYFAYFPPDGTSALTYVLDEDLVVANGSASASGDVTALESGTSYNDPSAGSTLQVLSTTPFLSSATLQASPAGGTDVESDEEYFSRAIAALKSYSAALTTADQIGAYILTNFPTAFRCKVYDRRRSADRDTTDSQYTTHDGYALVVVGAENADISDTSDTALSAQAKSDIQTAVNDLTHAGLVLDVVNVDIVTVDVTSTFNILDGYTIQEVEDSVDAAIQAYLNPNSWDWTNTVRQLEMVTVIDAVAGVDYVTAVTLAVGAGSASMSGNDVVFDLLGAMPEPGTLSTTGS